MIAITDCTPKTPEIKFMAKPKTPASTSGEGIDRYAREENARYYRNKQPPDVERWNHMQFRQWLKDMDYGAFDAKQVAGDLGVTTDRIYVYWRGQEKGKPVVLTKTLTLLCKAYLKLKRLGKWPL